MIQLLYRGHAVTELSKDELLEAFYELYGLYVSERERHESTLRVWELAQKARVSL